MGLARELAARITSMKYDDLPEEALYWGKVAILDTIGVTLAGALEEGPRIVDEVLGLPASGPSLIFGTRTSRSRARCGARERHGGARARLRQYGREPGRACGRGDGARDARRR